MGYCLNCEKCKRSYDINYFPEFCPYCYSKVDELQHTLNTLISELKKALPKQPRMDGIASYSHEQKIVFRAIKDCEDKLNGFY